MTSYDDFCMLCTFYIDYTCAFYIILTCSILLIISRYKYKIVQQANYITMVPCEGILHEYRNKAYTYVHHKSFHIYINVKAVLQYNLQLMVQLKC